jgi:hypothetical protein
MCELRRVRKAVRAVTPVLDGLWRAHLGATRRASTAPHQVVRTRQDGAFRTLRTPGSGDLAVAVATKFFAVGDRVSPIVPRFGEAKIARAMAAEDGR